VTVKLTAQIGDVGLIILFTMPVTQCQLPTVTFPFLSKKL